MIMKVAFGIFIILVGIMVLFFNPGWGLFERILENFSMTWPVILIFFGLAILSQVKGMKWLRIVNTLLMVIFVLYLLLWPNPFDLDVTNYYKSDLNLPIEAQAGSTIKLVFKTPLLGLKIKDGNSDNLRGSYSFRTKYFEIVSKGNEFVFQSSENVIFGPKNKITLELPEKYEYEITIESAVSDIELDMEKVSIRKLELESGITKLEIDTGNPHFPVYIKIKAGVASGKMYFSENTKYSLSVESAIKNVKVSDLIEEKNSPDVSISVEAAISNLKLEGKK
ncbi:MAG: hypothetical protein PWQ20_779 [Thermotogaceae bacterium]|nr:hypothetical protein [Thermotogaceae bacterium]MDN5337709.1 hypothetical protein [Thermotogaceae bacterium]